MAGVERNVPLVLTVLLCCMWMGDAQSHGDVRLTSGRTGYLQIYQYGVWKYLCDRPQFFTDQSKGAKVVCREIEYPTDNPHTWNDYHSYYSYITGRVECNGTEATIQECKHLPNSNQRCHNNRMHITCSADDPCLSSPCPEDHTCTKISDKRYECKPVDHCALSPCHHGNCSQGNDTDYTCACQPGWAGRNCSEDINECEENNGNCDHACVNEEGSHRCQCRTGFRLLENGRSCGECLINGNRCAHTCVNSSCAHSVHCQCHRGYLLGENGYSCKDIDECAKKKGGCEHLCANTPGSYHCTCRDGYYLGRQKRRCFQQAETITDECTCRLRVKASHTGLGPSLVDLVTLKYGEKILWAVERNHRTAYKVVEKHPNFLKTRKRRENAEEIDTYHDNETLSQGKDCQKMYQNCPRDCMRMSELLLGDQGFDRLTETSVYGHPVNSSFGQLMCNRLKKRVSPPGVTVMVSFYPRGCGSEVSFYKLPSLLCCEKISSPLLAGYFYLWNKKCSVGYDFRSLFRAM
ncbi:multiple epidermal growth factor-like domains protein 6 [Lingula anatina]|uniref:Multiple epidermal growth factor-like domains protein 6 n=1 Tax=Lingula anatina TaxID=7574 RepID=A0A1S3JNV5_LINAN|nr:multiple epidermal growth factor-like domains protein 6 [Lingula anatina]|eukprot:XP_013411664.1 multiple epidermal growth factor-like domains protein 6 [Lingula anatina]